MQTLGLSDSMPRSEGRLKSLFWPSIRSASDVDYLGAQGYWVCAIVAALSLAVSVFAQRPLLGIFVFLVFFLGGAGVRERSRYAAGSVLLIYGLDMLATGPSIIRILFAALLLANFRATWLSSQWKPGSDAAVVAPRWSETWTDKFADQLPMWLWPKIKIVYYILSGCYLVLTAVGLYLIFQRRI